MSQVTMALPVPACPCLTLPLSPQLRTRDGSEFLLQHDTEQIITAWHKAIADSIGRMVSTCHPPMSPWGWS